MCIAAFVVINVIVLLVGIGIVVFVVGAPVLSGCVCTSSFISILRYCYGFRSICMMMRMVTITGNVFIYYTVYIPSSIYMCLTWSNKKKLLTMYLCVWFGIAGAFGGGILITLLFLLFLRVRRSLTLIVLGGNDGNNAVTVLCTSMNIDKSKPDVVRKRPRNTIGKENSCAGGQPPSKRGRKSKMDSEHKCGECTAWLQTGSNKDLLKYHKREDRMRHPCKKVIEFGNFLSCNGAHKISLRTNSCLCNACYRDCVRETGKPRWLGLSKHLICKHCMICCRGPSGCTCDSIVEWGPMEWYQTKNELKL